MSKLGNETVCVDDAQAKQRAQAIKARMADLGHTIPLTHAYEIMATSFGHRNWPTMKAALNSSAAIAPAHAVIPLDVVTNGLINELAVTFEGDANIIKRMTRLGRGKVELIVGPPGKGKSTFVNALNILEVQSRLQAGKPLPEMFIAGLGHSYKDFVLAVAHALPATRKREIAILNLVKSGGATINPFDTSLGFRKPTDRQKHSLVAFLMTAAGEKGESIDPDCWSPILHQLIDRLYELRSDRQRGTHPKHFRPTIDPELTEELIRLDILVHPHEKKTWWQIVDVLCSRGLFDVAELAQRHAVPNIEDFLLLVSSPEASSFGATGDLAQIKLYVRRHISRHNSVGNRTTVDTRFSKIVLIDHGRLSNTRDGITAFSLSRLYIGRDIFLSVDDCSSLDAVVRGYHDRRIMERTENGFCVIYDDLEHFHDPHLGEALTRDAVSIQEIGGTLRAISQVSSSFKFFDIAAATDMYLLSHPALQDGELLRRFGTDYHNFDRPLNRLSGPGRDGLCIAAFNKTAQAPDPIVLLTMSSAALWATTASSQDAHIRDALSKLIGLPKAIAILSEKFPTQNVEGYIEKIARDRAATSSEHSYRDLLGMVWDELIDQLASNH